MFMNFKCIIYNILLTFLSSSVNIRSINETFCFIIFIADSSNSRFLHSTSFMYSLIQKRINFIKINNKFIKILSTHLFCILLSIVFSSESGKSFSSSYTEILLTIPKRISIAFWIYHDWANILRHSNKL